VSTRVQDLTAVDEVISPGSHLVPDLPVNAR